MLLLDKPRGVSSNTALQHARRLLNAAKAGHTGTLDPLATGLLPLCFGDATKFAQIVLDARKEYVATIRFGSATTTGDSEGEVVAQATVALDVAEIRAALTGFVGASRQVPPRHAALKYRGRNYYEYARAGIDIPRPARTVVIEALELIRYDAPEAQVRVTCSKGTYVRTLAEDIAIGLGTLGHLSALRRTVAGPFRVEEATTLDALEALRPDERGIRLLPVDAPLAALERLTVDATTATALLRGQTTPAPPEVAGRLRAYGPEERFIGLIEAASGVLRAVRLIDTADALPELALQSSDSLQGCPLAVES